MFLHDLALCLGRTVGELQMAMTTDELASWYAYARKTPLSPARWLDVLFAHLSVVVAESSGAKRKGSRRFTVGDFLLLKPVRPLAKTPKEFMQRLLGNRVKRKT